jgi:heme exporter protein D
MTLDLGKYAVEVLSAYGVSLFLLAGLTGWSWTRYRRIKSEMDRIDRARDG